MSNNSKSCLKHDIAKIEEWDIGQVKRGKKEGVIKKDCTEPVLWLRRSSF